MPDAPVTKFVLNMQGGRKGLLVNSTNLCLSTHRAIANFTAHNGKVHDTRPVVKPTGCPEAARRRSTSPLPDQVERLSTFASRSAQSAGEVLKPFV